MAEDPILIILKRLEGKLDRQEKSTASQFLFGLGIGFIGLALGIAVSSAASDKINTSGLMLLLLFGGALLIFWSPVVYRERYYKKMATAGTFLILISIVVMGFVVLPNRITYLLWPSLIVMIIGVVLLIICTLIPTKVNK